MKEMILRTANQADIPVLYSLWQEAFGDEKETIDLFFDTCFQPQNILVAVCGGRVRSVVYLLEATLINGEERFRAFYIYAAATEKSYRGQGLMRALLDFSAETAQTRGADYLYLVPASEPLFQYYEKCGFQTAFQKQLCTLTRAQLFEYAKCAKCEAPYVVLQEAALHFADKLAVRFGEGSICRENTFVSWVLTDGIAEVTALSDTNGTFSDALFALLDSCPAGQFTLPLPCGVSAENAENTAMLKALSARAKTQDIQNAFVGMTLG